MKHIIIGGSNSLPETGWVSVYRDLVAADDTVLNLSIGAAPNLMGFYSLSTVSDLARGDVVIWEYALNDENYIEHKGYDLQFLLRHCEHTVRHCIERGLRLVPLIFATQNAVKAGKMHPYRSELRALFSHYGLEYIDFTEAFPKRLKTDSLPPWVFQDRSHYKKNPIIINFIARQSFRLATCIQLPRKLKEPFLEGPPAEVEILTKFDQGAVSNFTNSRLNLPVWAPEPVDGHLAITVPGGAFRLIGLVLICSPNGGAFRINVGTTSFSISASYVAGRHRKALLKMFIFQNASITTTYWPGDTPVCISWQAERKGLLADYGFQSRPTDAMLGARESRVVALIVDRLAAVSI